MFNFSFGELLLIGTIALVVLGPDKLPGAARTAGMWIGKVKRTVSDLQNEVTAQFEAEELRRELKETQSKVDKGLSRLRQSIEGTDASLRRGIERTDQEVRRSLEGTSPDLGVTKTPLPESESPTAPSAAMPTADAVPPAPPEVREAPVPPRTNRRPVIAVGALNDPLHDSALEHPAEFASPNTQDHSRV